MTEQVIDKIDLSKFSDEDRAAIEAMQVEINLASTAAITTFCNVSSASAGIEALSAAMEQAPTSLLAGKIAEIVAKLGEADPRIVAEKPGWIARVTGAALEGKVRYQVSRKAVDTLIEEAERLSEHVVSLVDKLEAMMAAHAKESRQLELKMIAGKLYLERNPQAGMPPGRGFTGRRPGEATILERPFVALRQHRRHCAAHRDVLRANACCSSSTDRIRAPLKARSRPGGHYGNWQRLYILTVEQCQPVAHASLPQPGQRLE